MERKNAQGIVEKLLSALEARDLDTAESLMDPSATITFPGGKKFNSQREMAAAASGRYQWVKKKFEAVEAYSSDEGIIVYVRGALTGLNKHEIPFENIRFIDRFLVRDGLIVQQDVWNDLAELGVLTRTV